MATALSLFPARVKFTNQDGTLTPEGYRALQILSVRVGGSIGDNGVDVFNYFSSPEASGSGQGESAVTDMVIQQQEQREYSPDVVQPLPVEMFIPDVSQPPSVEMFIPDVVQPSSFLSPVTAPAAATGGGGGTAGGGFGSQTNRDDLITLVNAMRDALINAGLMT